MTLETLVCSLPLAKRLAELGVKQDSLFWWQNDDLKGGFHVLMEGQLYEGSEFTPRVADGDIAAFTAGELGEMLPDCVKIDDYMLFFRYSKDKQDSNHFVEYKGINGNEDVCITRVADSEADARCNMMIYLLENKLISL